MKGIEEKRARRLREVKDEMEQLQKRRDDYNGTRRRADTRFAD